MYLRIAGCIGTQTSNPYFQYLYTIFVKLEKELGTYDYIWGQELIVA